MNSGDVVEVSEEELKDKKFIYTPFVELSDGCLCEQGFDGEKVYYIVYNPKNGNIEILDLVVDGNKVYKPILNDDVLTKQVLFPSKVEPYSSEEELAYSVKDFLDYWHEQRIETERKLDVSYVFLTYIKDLLPQIPYRRALGRWGKGKSVWLETVGSICYRPVKLAGCDSEASIRRTLDLWRGTALIDEADFGRSDLFATIVKILNVGWSRLNGYYRCCDDRNPTKVLSFYVYGPKLLATREDFKDPALESRCLTFSAQENITIKPLFRMQKFEEEAQKLRNKLLMWRFKHYHEFKEKIARLEQTDFITELYGPNGNIPSRIMQVLAPLSLISSELKNGLKGIAEEIAEELKATDPEAQFEEQIKTTLREAFQEGEGGTFEPVEPFIGPPPQGSTEIKDVIRVQIKGLAEKIAENPNDRREIRSLTTKLGLFFRKSGFKVRQEDKGYNYTYIPVLWFKLNVNPPPNTSSKGSNVQPNLLERLEAYMQREKSVGKEKAKEDLELTEDQLRGLVSASKNVVWGPTKETLNWKPKEGNDS